MLSRFKHATATPDEEQAARLQISRGQWYTSRVFPPRQNGAETVPAAVKAVTERSTKWLGIKNTSETVAFEIRRNNPENVEIQFSVPTMRMQRKLRNELRQSVPGVEFEEGVNGLPIRQDQTVGGAMLTLARDNWYPVEIDHDHPPNNSITSLLHRHALPDAKIVVQLLARPVAGQPIKTWWWNKSAHRTSNYLKKEKEKLWGRRKPTKRERSQADAVERKAATPRFQTSLRVLVVGAEEMTPSYVREVADGYKIFESLDTDQYFITESVDVFRQKRIIDFAQAVADRRFSDWSRSFYVNEEELAALLSLPGQNQQNIKRASP